jgi:hypothetical protein
MHHEIVKYHKKMPKPHNVDEDMESEIAHNRGDYETVYYRVSIAAQSHDKYRVDNIYSQYSFICSGMKDEHRMRRALYYFDLALFREGRHRHRLLTNAYTADKQSSDMYNTMIAAYISFSEFVLKIDDESTIFINSAERILEKPLIKPTVCPIIRLQNCPDPIVFNLVFCNSCLRIEEPIFRNKDETTGEHICKNCRAARK